MSHSTDNEALELAEPPGATIDPAAQWLRVAVDLAPLVTFFGLYVLVGRPFAEHLVGAGPVSRLILATGGYMIVTAAVVTIAYVKQGRLAPMPLVTALAVLLFGGLTVIFQNDAFIKMKPTIIYLLFASLLIAGLITNRPFLRYLLQQMFDLTDEGWRILTVRWICFFVFLAVLNELVWRNLPEEVWVSFKLFGVLPLTVIFGMAQMPLLTRHATDRSESKHHTPAELDGE